MKSGNLKKREAMHSGKEGELSESLVNRGWEMKTIEEVSEVFIDGDWVESKDQASEGIRLIQTGNIGEGVFKNRSEKARFISESTFNRLRCSEVLKGDCLISRLPDPVGRSCLIPRNDKRMITAVDCTIVRFYKKLVFPPLFIYYSQSYDYLCSANVKTTGTTRKRISRSNLGQIDIPLPPLDEQRRIVGILDQAINCIATARANTERNLVNARALFESKLNEVLTHRGKGWVEKRLGDVCVLQRGFDLPSRYRVPGDFPLVSSSGVIDTHNEGPIKGPGVVTGRSGSIGNVFYVKSDYWPLNTVLYVKSFHSNYPKFIYRLLAHFDLKRFATGTGVPTLNRNFVHDEKVCVPQSETIQKTICDQFDILEYETQRLETLYRRKLAALDELKRSILHQAFSGELTANILFPEKIPGISTTDLHAGILAIAYQAHERHDRVATFGHVKAEKIAHMIEAHVGIELGRKPVKDAAGPNDYRHLKGVELRARKAGYFDFARDGDRYRVKKLGKLEDLVKRTREKLGDRIKDVDHLIELMLPMNTQQAEIFSTVYAAWNNLLLDGKALAEEDIVHEAREDWHPDKMRIPRERFFAAIKWMREKGITPSGKGNKVVVKATES